jgi:hypothetical protein
MRLVNTCMVSTVTLTRHIGVYSPSELSRDGPRATWHPLADSEGKRRRGDEGIITEANTLTTYAGYVAGLVSMLVKAATNQLGDQLGQAPWAQHTQSVSTAAREYAEGIHNILRHHNGEQGESFHHAPG